MRYDLHVHSQYSMDSASNLERLVERYANLGFAGFALTDHGNMDGLRLARSHAARRKLDLHIIGGTEFLTTVGEVIGLFIEEPILPSAAEIPAAPRGADPIAEFEARLDGPGSPPPHAHHPRRAPHARHDFATLCDAIHAQGGLAVIPHPFDPFRRSACPPDRLPPELHRLIDGIETLNARVVRASDNAHAFAWAEEHNLFQTGGSDAHFLFECGRAYTEIPAGEDLRTALRRKLSRPGGGPSPFFVHGPTTLVKHAKRLGWVREMEL